MKKSEFISKVAEQADVSKKDCEAVFDAVLATITDTLKKGEDVPFIGFGTFKTIERKAREGRNPSTGKPMSIAASKGVSFKAGSKLKEAIN